MGACVRFDDFAEALKGCGTSDAAWALLTRTAGDLGYCSVDYGLARLKAPVPRSAEDIEILHHLATNNWSARYQERGYAQVDRVTRAGLTRLSPYSYHALWRQPFESPLQREMEGEITATGVRSGLNVPLHGPGRLYGAVSFGSALAEEERTRLERETLPTVYLMAASFHERMQALLEVVEPISDLSQRERECLLWAARGKTAWETARILAVSESAVKKHYTSAANKLGAQTRTHAVAIAITRGLIQP